MFNKTVNKALIKPQINYTIRCLTRLVEFCKATLTQWFRVPLRPANKKFEMHQIHRNLQAASPSDLNEQLTSVCQLTSESTSYDMDGNTFCIIFV